MDQHEATEERGPTKAERDEAIARTREMIRKQRRGRRDRWPPVVFGSTFIVVSLIVLTQLRSLHIEQVVAICLLLPIYVLAQRLGLEDEDGSFVLTQSVFVVMLFLLPLATIPIIVLVGIVAGSPRDPSPYHAVYKLFHLAMNGWYCIGPVLVLAIADTGAASWSHWPVYAAALLAQFVFDAIVGVTCCIVSGGGVVAYVRSMLWTNAMDILLAAVGLAAVIATNGSLWAIAFAAAPIGMLFLLTIDRRAQLARAVAVTDAFDEAVEQSRVDALTTLANRRKWNEALALAEQRRTSEQNLFVTALVADVDGLKATNDTAGHHVGDELIRAAAELLLRAAPAGALVARLGGDEFGMLVVHEDGDVAAADVVAEIRDTVVHHPPIIGVRLSMSLGAASCPPAGSVLAAIELADQRTLADKRLRKVGRAS